MASGISVQANSESGARSRIRAKTFSCCPIIS
jgi:hypothetical protein